MRNSFCIIILAIGLSSCGSSNSVAKTSAKSKIPVPSTNIQKNLGQEKPKSEILHEGKYDFFKTNLADPTKNDNTLSYGSIVSATAPGFQVTKTYFPALAQNFRQRYIILHYTVLNDEKSISVLTAPGVSAHYLVNNLGDNEIYQLVDENKRAYHAGISAWRSDQMLNDISIGIEIVNQGYTTDSLGKKVFPEFSDHQIRKVAALTKDIAQRYMIPATNILGHSDIAPTRKQDPGPKFPWKKLYDEYQIGMWYDEQTRADLMQTEVLNDPYFGTNLSSSQFIYKYQSALKTFGYPIVASGILDDATKKTIEAFQYHFRPENYSGIMDAETWVILRALMLKYPSK